MPKTSKSVSNRNDDISVANECHLYSRELVKEKLDDLESDSDELRKIYKKMIKGSPERFLVKPSKMPEIEKLRQSIPNFNEPLDDIERQLSLCLDSGDPIELTPILLLGNPGVGKTHFAQELASILKTKSEFVPMGALTAGWVLSGSGSGWRGSKPGRVFESLFNGLFANPVIVLDEIDKASTNAQYDPLGPLYSLLERKTAGNFTDEFVEIPINASHVIWVTTANDFGFISKAILDRLNVYEIEPPNFEQARAIALNIYKTIREEHNWGDSFDEIPKDDVLDIFAKHTPRDMNSMWLRAFGNAKIVGRNSIEVRDITYPKNKRKKIGF